MPLEDEHLLLIKTEVDANHGKIIESAIQPLYQIMSKITCDGNLRCKDNITNTYRT